MSKAAGNRGPYRFQASIRQHDSENGTSFARRYTWGIALTNLVYNLARYEQIVRLKLDTWNHPVTAAVGNAAGLA